MICKKVLIRSYGSGVHFGTLKSIENNPSGKDVVLLESRRIHYWEGACSLSQVAIAGISSGRVAVVLPEIMISQVIEIIPLSDAAIVNLENQKIWKI